MKIITPLPGENLLDLGKRCNAVYVCPKVGSERKGPLVPYAGKDGKGRNLVGDIYFNFRRIEPHLEVVAAFASATWAKVHEQGLACTFDTVIGIPNGGRTFGQEFARIAGKRFVYADKEPKPADYAKSGQKQEYIWDLSQFDFEQGERVAIAEDVYNNFQNTDNTLAEISSTGVEVVLLVGALNRSPIHNTTYKGLPVIASIREAYPEYQQDDPAVATDIAAKNIEWEVKKNWDRIMVTMFSFDSMKQDGLR